MSSGTDGRAPDGDARERGSGKAPNVCVTDKERRKGIEDCTAYQQSDRTYARLTVLQKHLQSLATCPVVRTKLTVSSLMVGTPCRRL